MTTYKTVSVEPTQEMIVAGAKRLLSWEDGSEWPDSWSPLQVAAAKNEAERVWRSMWGVAQTRSQRLREAGFTRRPTWHSLPKDGDAESDKETGDSNE